MSFHSGVTLRASDYAPPDTGVSGLQLVAIEYLPSIEGADRICRPAPFCGEIIFICSALGRGGALLRPRVLILSEARAEQSPAPTERTPKAPLAGADSPYQGEMSRRDKRGRELSARRTERLSQIRLDLSVSASPSHLPWKGRLWAVLICKIILHYGNIAIYAKHSTLRYNNPPIPKETLALPRWFWYPESS